MSGQVLWAYVEDGGSLDLTVAFRNRVDGGSATTATIRALSPSGVNFEHSVPIAPNDPLPALHVLGLTDTRAGVWRITFEDGVGSGDHDAGIATWGITPRTSSGAAHKGRVFTEEYTQTVQATRPVDPSDAWNREWNETLYFLNRHGVTYEGILRRYNPIQGAISASPRGVLAADGTSRHASASFHDSTASVDPSRFRIFFEQPDPAMPVEATFAGGGAKWLGPDYRDPVITDITHAPTASTFDAPWAGTIGWTVTGAVGAPTVELDTNGDGLVDRILDAPSGTTQVVWDGKDSHGNVIAASSNVAVRIAMNEVGEIHFTLTDVEQLAGGLEVTALVGPQSGSKRLSWNDTGLGPRCDTNADSNAVPCGSEPSPLTATDVDSTGGVHAWSRAMSGTGGWGDARYIDNWTTTQVDVLATARFPGVRINALQTRSDHAATRSGTPVRIPILINDVDVDPDSVVILRHTKTSEGRWLLTKELSVVFKPNDGFHGRATTTYTVIEADGRRSTASITVTVKNAIVAVDDVKHISKVRTVTADVLSNDVGVGKNSQVTLVRSVGPGAWRVNADASVTYTPKRGSGGGGDGGLAEAWYRVTTPDGTTSRARVTIVVDDSSLPDPADEIPTADVAKHGGPKSGLPDLGGPSVLALLIAMISIAAGSVLFAASRLRVQEGAEG
jgi:hypothetical protein